MNAVDALEIVQGAIWTVIVAAAPPVLTALIVGITVALFQALTQIQEMTLTFVPKILAVFLVCTVAAPFMGSVIYTFSQEIYSRIQTGF